MIIFGPTIDLMTPNNDTITGKRGVRKSIKTRHFDRSKFPTRIICTFEETTTDRRN